LARGLLWFSLPLSCKGDEQTNVCRGNGARAGGGNTKQQRLSAQPAKNFTSKEFLKSRAPMRGASSKQICSVRIISYCCTH